MMKTLILSLIFSSLCQAAPIVTNTDGVINLKVENGDIEIILPVEAKKALVEWNPEFVTFNLKNYSPTILNMFKDDPQSFPMAFIADFDLNGAKDIVLLGGDLKRQYAVALIQKDKIWKAVEVASWALPDIKNTVIRTPNTPDAKKETGIPLYIFQAQDEHAKKLGKKPGIQTELYLGPAHVYEIKDDKAEKVLLK